MEGEGDALGVVVCEGDVAAEALGDAGDEGEADAGAFCGRGAGGLAAIEEVKDAGFVFVRYAGPGVGYGDAVLFFGLPAGYGDGAVGGGIEDGIFQQIVKQTLQEGFVGP